LGKLKCDSVTLVQPLRHADQYMTEVLEDTPVPAFVRIGKGRAGDITTKADVVQLLPVRVQAGFDIPQTLSPGHLGVSQTEELIEG
jgi:hypothetical protein